MPVTGPDFISLQARDLDASQAFYEHYLGLVRSPAGPPTLSSSRRRRSRSHCETSFPAPISRPSLSPASVPRSGSMPPTSRPFTTRSSPTATPSSRLRSTDLSAARSPSPTPTATTSRSTIAARCRRGVPSRGQPVMAENGADLHVDSEDCAAGDCAAVGRADSHAYPARREPGAGRASDAFRTAPPPVVMTSSTNVMVLPVTSASSARRHGPWSWLASGQSAPEGQSAN